MTTITEKRESSRIQRIAATGHMTAVDAIVLGVASLFGAFAEPVDSNVGINAPLYEGEPSTWCSRCKQQYWAARCPSCGK